MATQPAATTKAGSASGVPQTKPNCKIHPTATVADKAQLTGSHTIEIGENAIIHPHAKLRADYGSVYIGNGCIVAEKAAVGLGEMPSDGEADVVIGEGVSVESGAVVEARKVGDHAVMGINSRVGRGAVVGRWCKVGPLEQVKGVEVLEDFIVVFGEGGKGRRVDVGARDRKEVRDARMKGMEMERDVLRGIIVDSKMKWTNS